MGLNYRGPRREVDGDAVGGRRTLVSDHEHVAVRADGLKLDEQRGTHPLEHSGRVALPFDCRDPHVSPACDPGLADHCESVGERLGGAGEHDGLRADAARPTRPVHLLTRGTVAAKPTMVGRVVAAWPPVALFLAWELLMQVRDPVVGDPRS